jgi:hypothetical protein
MVDGFSSGALLDLRPTTEAISDYDRVFTTTANLGSRTRSPQLIDTLYGWPRSKPKDPASPQQPLSGI